MRSSFSLLMIGHGLFMVAGCALPDQKMSRSDEFLFRPKDRASKVALNEPSDSGKLSFKVPKRKTGLAKEDPESLLAEFDQQLGDKPPTRGKKETATPEFAHGHSNDFRNGGTPDERSTPRLARTDDGLVRPSSVDPMLSKSARVNDPHLNGNDDSSVRLDGLEFDDPVATTGQPNARRESSIDLTEIGSVQNGLSSKSREPGSEPAIQNWSDRPVARNVEQLAKGASTNPVASESIKQTNHAEIAQFSSKPNIAEQLPMLPWQADLEQMIARVEQHLAQTKPEDSSDRQTEFLRKQAHLRLLYMMAQRQEDALTAIPGATTSQQEFWQQMIWAMSNSTDTIQFPDPGERAAQAISPLSAALRQMRDEASLSIKNMTFCRKISYFGNYERFQRNEFTPGQEVLLYTEIENFVSTPTSDGEYRTSLKSLIEITDSKGKVVWMKSFPPTEDFCRNPRRDYFHNYQFLIPEDISTGTYSLNLTISDELSQKKISNSLNFVLK